MVVNLQMLAMVFQVQSYRELTRGRADLPPRVAELLTRLGSAASGWN